MDISAAQPSPVGASFVYVIGQQGGKERKEREDDLSEKNSPGLSCPFTFAVNMLVI